MTQTRVCDSQPLFRRLAARLVRWWHAPHNSGAVLGDAPADAIAHDIGLSTDQLANLIRHGHGDRRLMPTMVAQNGIDLAQIAKTEPALVRDMERVCALCGDIRACKRDLANGEGAQHYHQYCLNAATIDALKADDSFVNTVAVVTPKPAAAKTAAPAATPVKQLPVEQLMPSCCC
jgi:hypothetical protein